MVRLEHQSMGMYEVYRELLVTITLELMRRSGGSTGTIESVPAAFKTASRLAIARAIRSPCAR